METQSPKLSLNAFDRKKIGKGALIAMWGALLTYIQGWLLTVDFGQRAPIVMFANSVLVNRANKLLQWPTA